MKFLSPKGAVKDAKELEYLVALHQTAHAEIEEFRDGSIDDEDVKVFLMSRFGIKVTNEQVREYIFKGLAGGDGEDEAIDILEIVAILMIPMLVKVSDSVLGSRKRQSSLTSDQERLLPPETIIADVLQDILSDTTDGATSTSKPPQLTPLLLRKIFVQYDELDLVKDHALIDDMIAVASDGKPGATLDVEAFARALSSDVNLYNPENETRYTETFTDVFPNGVEEEQEKAKVGEQMKKVGTLSHMDYTADTFVHSLHVNMLWLVIVFSYFFYMMGIQDTTLTPRSDGFGYKYGYAVAGWLYTMVKLVVIGGLIGFFLGLGNGLPQTSVIGPILGLISTMVIVFVPVGYKGKGSFLSTDLEDNDLHASWPRMNNYMVVFGAVLILLQLKNLFDYFMPNYEPTKVYAFLDSIAGSNTQRAYRSKQAGIFKLNQLVRNAYDLHKLDEKTQERLNLKSGQRSDDPSDRHTSSKAIALQNYTNQVDDLEEVGGLFWSVKEYFSGRMAGTEGIWLPSRLLAANAIQFFASVIVISASGIVFNDLINLLYPKELPESLIISESCNTRFDYEKCYFPLEDQGVYAGVGVCRDVSFEGPDCYNLFQPAGDSFLEVIVGNTCESLEMPFTKLNNEALALLGHNCTAVLGAAQEFAIQIALDVGAADVTPEVVAYIINQCYAIKTMTEDDILRYNEWFVDKPDFRFIDDELIADCQEAGDHVKTDAFSDLAPGFEDLAFQTYELCMSAYGSIQMESQCQNLLSPIQPVYAYEKASAGDNYCVSFVSTCYIDPFKPTRGTCIIGAEGNSAYKFDGPTCKTNYPRINNTLIYKEQNAPPEIDVEAFFPSKFSLYLTAVMAIVAGSIVALVTTAVYIPSAIHTVLKFRCGVIPSLKDPNFLNYRVDLVNQTYMIGSMFWGLVVTTAMVTISVAIVVFLFVQPYTRDILIDILATLLGLATTIILRSVLCIIFLRTAYAGFYRKMPAIANAFMFGVECWNIALTAMSVIIRVVKFLVATSLYAGRMDRPVLAEGLALDIDSLPRIFRQNLLSAEAHRHPYLIQLGGMYLMKLRHKDDFGTKAGSIWRLLFVSALMPWLRKKRIQDDVQIDDEFKALMKEPDTPAGTLEEFSSPKTPSKKRSSQSKKRSSKIKVSVEE